MRDFWKSGLLFQIIAIVVLVILLGISPLPHVVERSYEEAGRSLFFKNPRAAAEHIALIANHLPNRLGLWEQAGDFAMMASDPRLALHYYKIAAGYGCLTPEGYVRFGDAYAQTNNSFTAVQIWKVASSLIPGNADPIVRIAGAYRTMGDVSSLIDVLKILISMPFSEPGKLINDLDLNYELGLLLAADDPVTAPPYLLQAFESDPGLKDARDLAFTIQRTLSYENPTYTLMVSGRKLGSLGLWELAVHAFRKVTNTQPEYSEGWAYLGEALQHVNKPYTIDIKKALDKALEIDPNSLSGNVFLAIYWLRNENPGLAYQHLSTAAGTDPANASILMDLGSAVAVLGDLEEADTHYRNAVNLSNNSPSAQHIYIDFLIRYNKDVREIALPTARQVLSMDMADPASLDLMGRVLFRLGDLITAERFFQQAVIRNPEFAPAYKHLGLLYTLQDKPILAADALTKAQSLENGSNNNTQSVPFFESQFLP